MKSLTFHRSQLLPFTLALSLLITGCGHHDSAASTQDEHDHDHAPAHHHEHVAPHGGTAIVLGDELYHLELVLDAETGVLQAYVMDGELENFIRSPMPSFQLSTTFGDTPHTLTFLPVANPATGETVGHTALFAAQADWLKTTPEFDATIDQITVRGTTFTGITFNFPAGNEHE